MLYYQKASKTISYDAIMLYKIKNLEGLLFGQLLHVPPSYHLITNSNKIMKFVFWELTFWKATDKK